MAPPEPTGDPVRVGRYEVIRHLATGGMAEIYLARQSGLGHFERHVVLKTILQSRAREKNFVTMFLDEAKLAATLNHQNVAQVYEVDQADGAYFMAMEYVHGENARALLETAIARGWRIPLELATMIVSGAAAGLHHAHERRGKNGQPLNIVHRDVSPANIMIGYDGSVKVLDFGIAKAEERITKTVGGTIKGKYGYMSPEQCRAKPIDRRSDIFALGIVLYELTTLRRAFKGNDDFATMKRIVGGDFAAPTTLVQGYPHELEAIVLTAMAKDPAARFQSAQELIEALDGFAVRAKLTGSNTAMARFMVQLFGPKKEPWLAGPSEAVVTTGEVTSDGADNEQTTLMPPRPEFAALENAERARLPTVPDPGVRDVRAAGWAHDAADPPRERRTPPPGRASEAPGAFGPVAREPRTPPSAELRVPGAFGPVAREPRTPSHPPALGEIALAPQPRMTPPPGVLVRGATPPSLPVMAPPSLTARATGQADVSEALAQPAPTASEPAALPIAPSSMKWFLIAILLVVCVVLIAVAIALAP